MEQYRTYLNRHAAGDSLIQKEPVNGLKYIVVIPSYIETSLEESLVSLFNSLLPSQAVEIIVVINWPEDDSHENIALSKELVLRYRAWAEKYSTEKKQFHILVSGNVPKKKAGVGFARKTGMDEAIRRFLRARQNDGILISFDADSKCEKNFLRSIDSHFLLNPSTTGCSFYFEHPLEGIEFSPEVYKAITQYELHMRYYLNALRYSRFPNAFYTMGSAFAVKASAYCLQGGMNIRKAGEDFYFLQKFFDLGNFSELNSTIVRPSPRPSLRVPFGTGKSVHQLLKTGDCLKSFNPAIFELLRELFASIPGIYTNLTDSGIPVIPDIHPCTLQFLDETDFNPNILEIYKNSSGLTAFMKRFYRYFNMFRILKYVKYARRTFPDLAVNDCAKILMSKTGIQVSGEMNEKELLFEFRRLDRLSTYRQ